MAPGPGAGTGLAAETPDDVKNLGCASLPEAFEGAETAIPEVMHPPPSFDNRHSFLLGLLQSRQPSRDNTDIGRSRCTAK